MLSIAEAAEKYKDDIFRIAFSFFKSADRSDDVVQEVLYRFCLCDKEFESEQHLKNWLVKVAVNQCRKEWRSPFRKRTVPMEDYIEALAFENPEQSELMLAVMELPQRDRSVVHLYYFESYSVNEISQILCVKPSTVQSRLLRARAKLKAYLKEEFDFEG